MASLAPQLVLAAQGFPAGPQPGAVRARRAVSTACDAVVHAVSELCADTLLPGSDKTGGDNARIDRPLDHGPLRTTSAQTFRAQPRLAKIAEAAILPQAERHKADYCAPEPSRFSTGTAAEFVDLASATIEDIRSIPPSSAQARLLATCLLFKDRRS